MKLVEGVCVYGDEEKYASVRVERCAPLSFSLSLSLCVCVCDCESALCTC